MSDLTIEDVPAIASGSRNPNVFSDAARRQLRTAISTCPEDRLREIVTELVGSVPAVEHAIFWKLVTAKNTGNQQRLAEEPFISRWEVCARCSVEFDAGTQRISGECTYHSGELEVNDEMFVDWDERCHGPMDTKSNIRDFPENFTWNCCDKDGTADGCEEGSHVPRESRKKRARR